MATADAALAAGPGAWREAGIAATRWPLLVRAGCRQPGRRPRLAGDARPPRDRLAPARLSRPAARRHPRHRRCCSSPATRTCSGTRRSPSSAAGGPAPRGRDHARQFAAAFAGRGLVVTSGLAEGVDTAAHLGALATGRTVAVVGTGPDLAYPAGNARPAGPHPGVRRRGQRTPARHPAPGQRISRRATASSPAWAWAPWWSRRPCARGP